MKHGLGPQEFPGHGKAPQANPKWNTVGWGSCLGGAPWEFIPIHTDLQGSKARSLCIAHQCPDSQNTHVCISLTSQEDSQRTPAESHQPECKPGSWCAREAQSSHQLACSISESRALGGGSVLKTLPDSSLRVSPCPRQGDPGLPSSLLRSKADLLD